MKYLLTFIIGVIFGVALVAFWYPTRTYYSDEFSIKTNLSITDELHALEAENKLIENKYTSNEEKIDSLYSNPIVLNNLLKQNDYLIEMIANNSLPIDYVKNATPIDQSEILHKEGTCNIEQLIRDNFQSHQLYISDRFSDEIWFYNFLRMISSNQVIVDSYLLELFIVKGINSNKLNIELKYFESLKKMLGKIKYSRGKGDGLSTLRTLLKQNCNG